MNNQFQEAFSHESSPHRSQRFSQEFLYKLALLMISAFGVLVVLFLLASTRLHKNQLTPSMLFDAFVIVFGLYILYTITGLLIQLELPNIWNSDVVGIVWEFTVFLASGGLVHMLNDDTRPTLLFDTTGFYITGILALSILLLGEVIELPVSGFLDTLRGLNAAISFSLYQKQPVYTYVGISCCFLMICTIRILQKRRRDGQQMSESGSVLLPDELQLAQAADLIRPPSTLVQSQGQETDAAHTVEMPEYSRPEFSPISGEIQGIDSEHLTGEDLTEAIPSSDCP